MLRFIILYVKLIAEYFCQLLKIYFRHGVLYMYPIIFTYKLVLRWAFKLGAHILSASS